MSAHHSKAAQVQYVFPPASFRSPPNTSHLPIVNLSRAITLPAFGQPQYCTSVKFIAAKICRQRQACPGAKELQRKWSDLTINVYAQEDKFSRFSSKHCVTSSPKESEIWIHCKNNHCSLLPHFLLSWDYKHEDK